MPRPFASSLCIGWVVLLGCGALPLPSPPPDDSAAGTPYQTLVDSRQLMLWILEPAAEGIWDSSGFVITAEGETDLSPSSEEGWDRVRDSASLVGETGNLLMLPGRSMGPEWIAYAQGMIAASRGVLGAVERRDATALFDAGGALYQSCRACHSRYMVPIQPLETDG